MSQIVVEFREQDLREFIKMMGQLPNIATQMNLVSARAMIDAEGLKWSLNWSTWTPGAGTVTTDD